MLADCRLQMENKWMDGSSEFKIRGRGRVVGRGLLGLCEWKPWKDNRSHYARPASSFDKSGQASTWDMPLRLQAGMHACMDGAAHGTGWRSGRKA